ncbi:MAG: terminase large subunit, partial [Nanoarchaeota archaeon]
MWLSGINPNRNFPDINKQLLELKGELDDKAAKISLAKFLRYNLGFAIRLMTGDKFKLYPYQEIILKGLFNHRSSLIVMSRGGGKSLIIAVFAILYSIFEPNSEIVIVSSNFRNARNVFAKMESIINLPTARLLKQCFSSYKPDKRNDMLMWKINDGVIRFVPSSGENLRGLRANVLMIDEMRLLGNETIQEVLLPLLVAPKNIGFRQSIREIED